MKAIKLEKPFDVGCIDVDKPVAGEGEALLKINAAGICGSDIGAFRGTNGLVSYPRIIGHELAGEVISISANNKGIKAGDRVVVDPYIYCGHCYPCKIGRTNCCTDLPQYSARLPFRFAPPVAPHALFPFCHRNLCINLRK